MRALSLISIFLFFTSCLEQGGRQTPFFEDELYATFEVGELNPHIVGEDSLELAPGTWHPAMRLAAYANDFERIDYCLLVKAPFELEPGKIKFVRAASLEEECSEFLFEKPVSKVKEFYNISIDYDLDKLSIKLDQEEYEYSFFNLREGVVDISLQGGDSSPGRALLQDGEVCLKVENDCSRSKDLCGRCEGGSYYVKNSSCTTAYSKVCGRDNCGEKGEPACIRGHISTGVMDYCIQDSPVGFCSEGSRVGCVNGSLVCE